MALLACFFRFALRGYGFLALALFAAAAAVLLLALLPRKARIVLLALIIAFGAVFWHFESRILDAAKGDDPERADYLIVLGAAVYGNSPSPSLAWRLQAAEAFLKAHPECIAIVSGGLGDGENISEGSCMKAWLEARGIESSRVIAEEKARSTEENLKYSAEIMESREGPDWRELDIVLCSSEYHLYRAQYRAARLGYTIGAVPGRTTLPVLRANYFIREGLGALYYHILDRA